MTELFCDVFGPENIMIHDDWKVYRWAYMQLKDQPEKMKDEMLITRSRNKTSYA